MIDNSNLTNSFIGNLTRELVLICTDNHILNRQLYDIEELMEKWDASAPQYLADVVPEFSQYPTVAIAWAAYYGMGAAVYWDCRWDNVKDTPDLYVAIRDKRGFDNMDDYVMEEMLGIKESSEDKRDADDAVRINDTIRKCAELALSKLTHQGIEPGTREAYLAFAKVAKLFFHLGVSIQLYRMGYRYEKMMQN